MSLVIRNISKSYGKFIAINDISIDVHHGEFLALLGPSGSGKTTLLRIIAGLETADAGDIYLEGKDAQNQTIREREIGFVFQHFALFKHLSIFENIAFGLRLKRPRLQEADIRRKVHELLELVHLSGIEYKYPSELSGGQRQRVALARVLAVEPKYMLLDEPFGALDAKVRKELRRWLKKLHDTTGLTTIFVTHDQEEALEIADRVAILNKGSLVQLDDPASLWEQPKNHFVYDFLGEYNTFEGTLTPEGNLILNPPPKSSLQFFARPYEIALEKEPENPEFFVTGKVSFIRTAGPMVRIELETDCGRAYLVELQKNLFDTLNIKPKVSVSVRPLVYRTF